MFKQETILTETLAPDQDLLEWKKEIRIKLFVRLKQGHGFLITGHFL